MAREDPLIGTLFADRFQIEAVVGTGGMGTVYRATQQVLGRTVALKLLSFRALANPKSLRRFEREARAACRIQHPHITQVYDFGHSDDGIPYLVMELVEGQTLHEAMNGGLFPLQRALGVLAQIVDALAAAHRADVIHRDLKPQNILLRRESGAGPAGGAGAADFVKILDFGISKIRGPDSSTGLTTEGTSLGTPEYMAPEQVVDEDVDHRADIYSLGVVAYELLTGEPPFSGTTMEVMKAHVVRQAPAPSSVRDGLPSELDAVILRCLAKTPEDRFGDASELAGALAAIGAM